MEYTREYWQPRIATNPNRFRKLNESNDYVELINEPEAITQAGTAFTAPRLNNMESGITGAVAGVNDIQGVVDFTTLLGAQTSLLENKYVTDVLNASGDIYACVYNGGIYKQTGGVGSFVALGQTSRPWIRLATNGTDVYAIVTQGGIYKQTAKSGDFVSVYSSSLYWSKIEAHNNDIYASAANGSIYKQTGGSGSFVEVGTYSGSMKSLFSHKGDLYYITDRNALYRKNQGDDTFSFLRSIDVYLYMRSAEAGLFCYYDGYLSIVGDDIRLQKNIEQVLNFSSFTSIDDKMYISRQGSNGDIYTAPFLTGNTFRAPSSFTLPAMPDGARKRILNTHATTAITVTAYSGTTIEGQATMTLSAGHEVELELIGTDWRKTGWNEKALLTYSVPVDCSSRVAEYTGDGIPLIPDNVAGTMYESNFTTTDGWVAENGGSVSVSNGILIYTHTGATQYLTKPLSIAPGKSVVLRIRVKGNVPSNILKIINVITSNGSQQIVTDGSWNTITIATTGSGTSIAFYLDGFTSTNTYIMEIDTVYIGTGAYDTPALDRAGNGNSLALTAVTPVNGKYGKEMSFNGSTSYAQASSPVIGTTGTVAIRFKRSAIGQHGLCYNSNAPTNGMTMYFASNNALRFAFSNGSKYVGYGTKTYTDTTAYNTVVINSLGQVFYDGVLSSADTIPTNWVSGLQDFIIGRDIAVADSYYNGIISHFRYDSRIWTADEARAWSLNPISIDSRV